MILPAIKAEVDVDLRILTTKFQNFSSFRIQLLNIHVRVHIINLDIRPVAELRRVQSMNLGIGTRQSIETPIMK